MADFAVLIDSAFLSGIRAPFWIAVGVFSALVAVSVFLVIRALKAEKDDAD